ncbi:MAG: aldo/keto reductase [Cyclobacteriaceae bacterium]|nr:aldo/keto reductase [Cyclobacteriaceae bacterium]
MQKINVGNSDLQISRIVFGAWAIGGWLWGGNDDKDALEAIHASLDHGITSIDTAPAYGFGHSEQLVAKALRGKSRDKVEILTKFGLRWDTTKGLLHFKTQANDGSPVDMMKYAGKDGIRKEIEDSLRRLDTDYIDLYQIHWPDPTTPISETMEALLRLKEEGKIREVGVCNYSAGEMKEAEKTLSLASNQVPYSMVLRDIEQEVVPYVLENGKGILAYSPLQRGLLTGKIKDGFVFGKGDHRPGTKYFQEPNLGNTHAFLEKIKPIASAHQASLAQLVIQWTLCQPGITAALVGARNARQVIQNAGAMEVSLAKEELALINHELSLLKIV